MDIQSAAAATTQTPLAASSKQGVTADYQTFLNMMTTQLRNQDPTSPMDSDQFAVQLATFSGVEQQVKTNELLGRLVGTAGAQTLAQLTGWVGQEARVDAPLRFDGVPITLSPNPAAAATRAILVVRAQDGHEVDRRDMPLSASNYAWNGRDSSGDLLPSGTYSLALESYDGDQLIATTGVEYYAPVQEIRSGPQGASLLLPGQIEVDAAQVTALRRPMGS